MPGPYISRGVELAYEHSSAFVVIPRLLSVSHTGRTTGKADITHLASENAVKEYMAGWTEPGQINAECAFDSGLVGDLEAVRGVTITWRLKGPNGTHGQFTAEGFIVDIVTPTHTVADEQAKMSFVVQLTGDWDYAEGSV